MTTLRPRVRPRDKGTVRHLVDLEDPADLALCGRPGPWAAVPEDSQAKRCEDCATSQQRQTNHVGGRVWAGI